jgi:hypothetical protein
MLALTLGVVASLEIGVGEARAGGTCGVAAGPLLT